MGVGGQQPAAAICLLRCWDAHLPSLPSPLPGPCWWQEERKAAALREGGLSTYRQQMSFGVHVLAMMGAFYAFGHVAGMGLTSNKAVVSWGCNSAAGMSGSACRLATSRLRIREARSMLAAPLACIAGRWCVAAHACIVRRHHIMQVCLPAPLLRSAPGLGPTRPSSCVCSTPLWASCSWCLLW